jgi:hypothetical protein
MLGIEALVSSEAGAASGAGATSGAGAAKGAGAASGAGAVSGAGAANGAGAARGAGAGKAIGAGNDAGTDFGWIPRARMGAFRFQSCAEARSKDEATRVVPKDKLAIKKALFRVLARWIFDETIT